MMLMKELQNLQTKVGCLPLDELKKLPYPLPETLGTASFYDFFTFEEGAEDRHIENIYPCRKTGMLLDGEHFDWKCIEKAASAPERIMEELRKSGLTGRGGGAFPTASKWESTANTSGDMKYVVCNADEGEPGTGKDRVLLALNPRAVVAGMAVCAIAVGAKKGYIYLRGEYADLKENIEKAIAEAPLNSFEIELCLGMGAYVCGEETALLESMEGKRGEPRLKPPYPGISGLYGKPTVINNAETFACAAYIMAMGGEAYAEEATKLYTVSGCVDRPGVYECPLGTGLGELLSMAGGKGEDLAAVQIGGGSGSIIGELPADLSMEPKSCMEYGVSLGTGSLRFIGKNEDIRGYVTALMKFYSKESCGVCVPCRSGLALLATMLEDEESDDGQIISLAEHIRSTARCGLGQAAVTPVLSYLKGGL